MKHTHILLLLVFLLFCGCSRRFEAKKVEVGNDNYVQEMHNQERTRVISKEEFIQLISKLDGSEEYIFEKGAMYRMTTPRFFVGDMKNEMGRISICDFNSGFVYNNVRYINKGNIDELIPENKMR